MLVVVPGSIVIMRLREEETIRRTKGEERKEEPGRIIKSDEPFRLQIPDRRN